MSYQALVIRQAVLHSSLFWAALLHRISLTRFTTPGTRRRYLGSIYRCLGMAIFEAGSVCISSEIRVIREGSPINLAEGEGVA